MVDIADSAQAGIPADGRPHAPRRGAGVGLADNIARRADDLAGQPQDRLALRQEQRLAIGHVDRPVVVRVEAVVADQEEVIAQQDQGAGAEEALRREGQDCDRIQSGIRGIEARRSRARGPGGTAKSASVSGKSTLQVIGDDCEAI